MSNDTEYKGYDRVLPEKQETQTFHSTYKGYDIVKVIQDNGRVTYDVYPESAGQRCAYLDVIDQGFESLTVTKANIRAICEQ